MNCGCTDVDLRRLNSLTKYPSIPTLHEMGEKGRLGDLAVRFSDGLAVYTTEKIDGANARLVSLPWGCWLAGSREDWLAHKGDLLHAKAERIVEALGARIIDRLLPREATDDLKVWYGEVYGAKVGQGAKNYAGGDRLGFRIFDVLRMTRQDAQAVLDKPPEEIASWRDSGGQPFLATDALEVAARGCACVPRLLRVGAEELHGGHAETLELLRRLVPESHAGLDDGARRRPEGVVFRAADRSVIAKARFEDYERALR